MLFNIILLYRYSKPILSSVLFPYASDWLKVDYRWKMNLKMASDVKRSFKKALEVIRHRMMPNQNVLS